MKTFFTYFFVTLGVIFFVLLLVASYVYFADPFGFFSSASYKSAAGDEQVDRNPALNASQEKAVESFGIDPASLPSSITPAQEACAREKLGDQRVEEIKGGDAPTPTDYYKARSCF